MARTRLFHPEPLSSNHQRSLKTLRQRFIPDSGERHKTGRGSETGGFAKSQLGQEDCGHCWTLRTEEEMLGPEGPRVAAVVGIFTDLPAAAVERSKVAIPSS